MEKFISYEKMSKKQQRQVDAAKRGSWGLVKPITKVKPSGKVYNRKAAKQALKNYSNGSLKPVFYYFIYLSRPSAVAGPPSPVRTHYCQ